MLAGTGLVFRTARRRRPFGSATPFKGSFDGKLAHLVFDNSPSKGRTLGFHFGNGIEIM